MNLKIFVIYVFGIIYYCGINVGGSGFGKCPNYPTMPKFNMTQVKLVQ